MFFRVRVIPLAKVTQVVEEGQDLFGCPVLRVKVLAPPEKGQANQAMITLLAAHFQVPVRCVVLKAGHTSCHKSVEIQGL